MSQRITTRLVLDVHRPYFPGESIPGKVMLACPTSITPHAIRLIWAGGVTIRPTLQDHESHIYFRRSYAICNDKLIGKKIANGVAYRSSAFVENFDIAKPLNLTLEQSVTYSFAFDVQVPSDIPLPSSTETEASMLGGKIVYTIECCIDFIKDDPEPARSHIMVTVLEHMDVRLPALAVPRSEESVCSLWLPHTPLASPCNYRTAMRVTVPCQASTRGGQAEIVIHVWHSVEYQRLKGVKVSLVRLRQLHFNGSVYAFPDETVLAMRADVNLKQDKNFMQTLRCRLPIREDLTPSISDSAKLLEISYKLQIKVQLQEGTYQSLDGECKGYMMVELPFLIGTVPLIVGKRPMAPPKNFPSGSSKKSGDIKDNNNGLMPLTESIGKQDNYAIDRKVSKGKSKSGLKIGTLRDILRFPGSKPKPKENLTATIATDNSTQSSSSTHHPDDESILSHSRTSSSKNTDQDLPYSTPDDSNTSHSSPSPTTTESRSQNRMQAQQTSSLFEPRNIRPTNTYLYSPDEEITTSPYELKPDAKDDEYFDNDRFAAFNKSKADAIATASIVSPIDGSKLMPPRMDSLASSASEDKFVKDDSISDNGDLRQVFDKAPAPPPPTAAIIADDIPKKSHPVHYHDIFGSSGEDDSDDENISNSNPRDDNSGPKGEYIHADNIKDNTVMTINTATENDDKRQYLQQTNRSTVTPLASFQRQGQQFPSLPVDQIEYNKLHADESDSSDDDSPVAMMSKQSRRQ